MVCDSIRNLGMISVLNTNQDWEEEKYIAFHQPNEYCIDVEDAKATPCFLYKVGKK